MLVLQLSTDTNIIRFVQGKKGVEGKCQKKGECMKAGLAAFSKSGRTDISGTIEELACPGGEWPLSYVSSSRLTCVRETKRTKKFNAV